MVKRVLGALLVLVVVAVAGFTLLREPSGSLTPQAAAADGVAPATSVPTRGVTTERPVPPVPGALEARPSTTLAASTTTTTVPASIPTGAPNLTVPILMYHYVDATPPPVGPYAAGLTVRTADFEAEMALLEHGGYHTVTFDQLWRAMAGQTPLPSKPVLLTFDDGGRDNYTVAFPILQRHG